MYTTAYYVCHIYYYASIIYISNHLTNKYYASNVKPLEKFWYVIVDQEGRNQLGMYTLREKVLLFFSLASYWVYTYVLLIPKENRRQIKEITCTEKKTRAWCYAMK